MPKIEQLLMFFIVTWFLLCAFQCGKDNFEPSTTAPPAMHFKIRPNVDRIMVGDTLWLSSKVTNKVFDFTKNDSVTYKPYSSYIYFYRLKQAGSASDYNTTPAAKSFTCLPLQGQVTFDQTLSWNDYRIILVPALTVDSAFFSIVAGVIPKTTGDFAIVNLNNAFNVEYFNTDLYLPYGSIYASSFAATYPKGVGWYLIDTRFYFFKVDPSP